MANGGSAPAQAQLGFMYSSGLGVSEDHAEAVRWSRLAADQGLARAQHNLGVHYRDGLGVPQDDVQVHMWSNLAASRLTGDDRETAAELRDRVRAG